METISESIRGILAVAVGVAVAETITEVAKSNEKKEEMQKEN